MIAYCVIINPKCCEYLEDIPKGGTMLFKKGNKKHTEHYKGSAWFKRNLNKYLKSREDEEIEVVRQKGKGKSNYEIYYTKFKVRLPTVEGFADFIKFTKPTLYNWAKKHKEVKQGINEIVNEQLTRLVDCGLEGTYNSTIAKLILSSNHGMREKTDVTTDDQPIPLLGGISIQK